MSRQYSLKLPILVTAAVTAVAAISFAGCQAQTQPVDFTFTVPAANEISFTATLTQQYGIGLSGSYTLPNNVGTITLDPEAPGTGFGLNLELNTSAFLQSTWVQYSQVTTLPNGGAFPTWMTGPVVDVTSPDLNQAGVAYHVYFGDLNQWYVGVAGVIAAINSNNFPNVNVGYTFYDTKGDVVVGFQFFGPSATSAGGIFIGTNLSPFIAAATPAPTPTPTPTPSASASTLSVVPSTAHMLELVQAANAGLPIEINGKSVIADVVTSGPDAGNYRTEKQIRDLVSRFTAASRGAH